MLAALSLSSALVFVNLVWIICVSAFFVVCLVLIRRGCISICWCLFGWGRGLLVLRTLTVAVKWFLGLMVVLIS